MGTHQVELEDIATGRRPSRKRLLAPFRYLSIRHPEKTAYDVIVPSFWAAVLFAGYWLIEPKPALFGDGLIKLTRDLLIMAVPFMVGALAAVAMGSPGSHLDRRIIGSPIYLDGEALTLRQFVCYLLGYLCLLGMISLIATVVATVLQPAVTLWTAGNADAQIIVRVAGTAVLFLLLSALTITVLWSLYFLTAVVNKS